MLSCICKSGLGGVGYQLANVLLNQVINIYNRTGRKFKKPLLKEELISGKMLSSPT